MATTATRNKFVERTKEAFAGITEPKVAEASYQIDIISAFNYYNIHETSKNLRKWAMTHIKKNNPTLLTVIDRAPDYELQQVGVLSRLLAREQFLSEKHKAVLTDKILEIYNRFNIKKKVVVTTPAVVVSIEDRVRDTVRRHCAEIDAAIDEFVLTRTLSAASIKTYLLTNTVSSMVSKRIGEVYKPLQKELTEAVAGKDTQLKEGYAHLNKSQLKKFLAYVDSIILDCQQVAVKVSKPRAKKVKAPGVLVAKMKYQVANDELKLKSCNPSDIIGSEELWVFNAKYRRLTVYRATEGNTLSVKGTTILNYDLAKSEIKTIRKPAEFFKGLSLTKRPMNNAFKAIVGKPAKPNGRVNEDVIILKAF